MKRIETYFAPLLEKPCWGISECYGGLLEFNFGKPYLEIHEPQRTRRDALKKVKELFAQRHIFVRGQWRLCTVGASWIAENRGRVVGTSKRQRTVELAISHLDGQKLTAVKVSRKSGETELRFDLGGRLTISAGESEELWSLREPGDNFLVLFTNRTFTYSHGSEQNPVRHDLH